MPDESQKDTPEYTSGYPDQVSHEAETEPDVVLDVPLLRIGEVKLDVENLEAKICINARLASFIHIEVGTKVFVEKAKLEIKEVEAEAYLRARLKRVEAIFMKALKTLDENPDLIKDLISNADKKINETPDK